MCSSAGRSNRCDSEWHFGVLVTCVYGCGGGCSSAGRQDGVTGRSRVAFWCVGYMCLRRCHAVIISV